MTSEKKIEYSEHAKDMLKERTLDEEWVVDAINHPDRKLEANKGETHYIKKIKDYGNRYLRVVAEETKGKVRIITVFSTED